jgi:hypothetical protein
MAKQATKSQEMGDGSQDVEQYRQVAIVTDHDYPIERIEAVYRKLDLRIIPGRTARSSIV